MSLAGFLYEFFPAQNAPKNPNRRWGYSPTVFLFEKFRKWLWENHQIKPLFVSARHPHVRFIGTSSHNQEILMPKASKPNESAEESKCFYSIRTWQCRHHKTYCDIMLSWRQRRALNSPIIQKASPVVNLRFREAIV
jgi:hypothetical protein